MIRNSIFVLTLSLFIISCNQELEQKSVSGFETELNYINKTKNRNKLLLNKQITSKDWRTVSDSIPRQISEDKAVLIVTLSSDCSGCRKKAFQIGQRINSQFGTNMVIVAGNNLKLDFERNDNGMADLYYVEDKHIFFKDHLNISHTPTLIYLKDGQILNTLSIFTYGSFEGYDEDQISTDFLANIIFDK